jgi:hypothetical protein
MDQNNENKISPLGSFITGIVVSAGAVAIGLMVKDQHEKAQAETKRDKERDREMMRDELKRELRAEQRHEEEGPQGDPLAAFEHAQSQAAHAEYRFERAGNALRMHFVAEEHRAKRIAALRAAALAGKDLTKPETWATEEPSTPSNGHRKATVAFDPSFLSPDEDRGL